MEEEFTGLFCDCCEHLIPNERDAYEHEPSGVLVCEECHEMLLNSPAEIEDMDVEDLLAAMSIS
jgi:hypothetical protein